MARELDRLASDRARGARPLGTAALVALERWARAAEPGSVSGSTLRSLATRLRRVQPAMANFERWADALRALARGPSREDRSAEVLRWVRGERTRLRRELPRLRGIAARRLPPRIRMVTLSRSETLRDVLAHLGPNRRPREVVVLESLPGGEGRAFASDLRRAGLRARCVADARGPAELRQADAMLIGADAIYRDGSVLHKRGTRSMAAVAHRLGKPVYVLAGSSKILDRRPAGTRPGPLFDRTPASWLTEIWTDAGPVAAFRWPDSHRLPRRRRDRASRRP